MFKKTIHTCGLGLVMVFSNPAFSEELINCIPENGLGSGDNLDRAFYVDSYQGTTLDEVIMFFHAGTSGEAVYEMTARANAFNGPLIGVSRTTYFIDSNSVDAPVSFDFRRAPISFGQRVTFSMEQISGPETFMSVTSAPGCVIVETASSTPPLSSDRRDGLPVVILGASEALTPSIANLEFPQPGTVNSGLGTISGWICDAQRVDLVVDGSIVIEPPYGTPRNDTVGSCGDSNNGFGVPLLWSVLGSGNHTIELFADGLLVDSANFDVD